MTMHRGQLEDFSDAFEAIALSSINAEDLLPRMRYDAEIEPEDIDEALLNIIMRMAPFGPGNLNPVFFGSDLRDDGSGRIIGSTAEHIRLNIVSATGSIPAIGFGMADQFETIKKTGSFEACFQIQENIFRGIRNLQLNLKALRPTSGTGSIVSEKD
jgi:single-stranded-DNA-specific exonuclease